MTLIVSEQFFYIFFLAHNYKLATMTNEYPLKPKFLIFLYTQSQKILTLTPTQPYLNLNGISIRKILHKVLYFQNRNFGIILYIKPQLKPIKINSIQFENKHLSGRKYEICVMR